MQTMTHKCPITILIVDDHEIIRRGLKMRLALEPDFAVVGEAASGKDALEQARLLKPDIVLMDVNMPQMDGITATHRMNIVSPHSAIILLSLADDERIRQIALDAGARAFLPKHSQTDPLIFTVRQLVDCPTAIPNHSIAFAG